MSEHRFAAVGGADLTVDICFPCQGLWLDRLENMRLAPQAVVELFTVLHEHRTDERRALADKLNCARCNTTLTQGFDVVRSGRYMTYRCRHQHGRFSTFSAFLIEKGFVRQMTKVEVEDLAQRVGSIYCTSCGAPVDLRKDHACPYCRAAFSLLDPTAVQKALEGYAQLAARPAADAPRPDLADALIRLERDRSEAQRERQARIFTQGDPRERESGITGDLVAAGVGLVWALLSH
ncbi:hypothetical protein GCM10023090_23110 [Acidovorax lacteus]|uniref:Transcription factor zinc-finger domain-containing protein n=2 Tax=Acidovorax lacteus TaxID=1924988 RepID=A0ABP8LD79_9BURK